MNAPAKLSVVEQIRAQHGDRCWLCDGKLDFTAKGNARKAPTKEHLVAKSLGGGDELANLRLCHPGCNKQLGNRPLAEKEKIRAKMAANRARVAAKKAGAPVSSAREVPERQAMATRTAQPRDEQRLREQLRRWRNFGLASAGAALLLLGLVVGLLLR